MVARDCSPSAQEVEAEKKKSQLGASLGYIVDIVGSHSQKPTK